MQRGTSAVDWWLGMNKKLESLMSSNLSPDSITWYPEKNVKTYFIMLNWFHQKMWPDLGLKSIDSFSNLKISFYRLCSSNRRPFPAAIQKICLQCSSTIWGSPIGRVSARSATRSRPEWRKGCWQQPRWIEISFLTKTFWNEKKIQHLRRRTKLTLR